MQLINRPIEQGVILRRVRNPETLVEEVATNVEHKVVYHSPTGFEWGYGGSGPADLALNLAELVVEKVHLVSQRGPKCYEIAWDAKHNVKELLIAPLNQECNHIIPWKLVCYAVFDSLRPAQEAYTSNRRKLLRYIEGL